MVKGSLLEAAEHGLELRIVHELRMHSRSESARVHQKSFEPCCEVRVSGFGFRVSCFGCRAKVDKHEPSRDLLGIPFEMLGLRAAVELPFVEASGEVPRGEKMLYSGTDPGPYITEYTSVYEQHIKQLQCIFFFWWCADLGSHARTSAPGTSSRCLQPSPT